MSKAQKIQFQIDAHIVDYQCANEICTLVLQAPEIARTAVAGQFVMVATGDEKSHDPLLRRPFSISQCANGTIGLVYKVVGRGTKLLSKMTAGQKVNLVGPLGKGFNLHSQEKHYLVGGGMGIAPLPFLAATLREKFSDDPIAVLLGARNRDELICLDDFEEIDNITVAYATDDGSVGYHGLVPDLLPDNMNGTVYCCGPWPMMKAVAAISRQRGAACQVSLETMMACGMGACVGCAIQGVDFIENGYLHVCKDGPIFEAEKIWL